MQRDAHACTALHQTSTAVVLSDWSHNVDTQDNGTDEEQQPGEASEGNGGLTRVAGSLVLSVSVLLGVWVILAIVLVETLTGTISWVVGGGSVEMTRVLTDVLGVDNEGGNPHAAHHDLKEEVHANVDQTGDNGSEEEHTHCVKSGDHTSRQHVVGTLRAVEMVRAHHVR